MMAELIDRWQKKHEAAELLRDAQVPPVRMTALYLFLLLGLDLIDSFQFQTSGTAGTMLSIFVSVLTTLLTVVLGAGFVLYLMAIRRRASGIFDLIRWIFLCGKADRRGAADFPLYYTLVLSLHHPWIHRSVPLPLRSV